MKKFKKTSFCTSNPIFDASIKKHEQRPKYQLKMIFGLKLFKLFFSKATNRLQDLTEKMRVKLYHSII